MKKIITIILSFCLMLSGTVVFADEPENNLEKDNVTNYWAERFPSFKESVDNNSLGKLVGSNEMYVKYTPKDTSDVKSFNSKSENEFTSELFTKEEYDCEIIKENIKTRSIGGFEPNGSCSWLRLDLQVYDTPTYGEYSATSFWEWKTNPQFRLNDLNGIYVSSEMIIGKNTPTNSMSAEFRYKEQNSNVWSISRPGTTLSQFGNGIAVAINLPGDSELFTHNSFRGMLTTPIKFSNNSSNSARVFTSYGHSYISIGSPSFGSDGKPSFGFTNARNEHSGSVLIER
ncbi:hypothetical protein [Clostridium sp.]|uniref:hypothetical protein n=1 Tax=Clostridium sp. TaxID=1506 RepID=UPI003216A443